MLRQQHEEDRAHQPGELSSQQPRLGDRRHAPAETSGERERDESHHDRGSDPEPDPGNAVAARLKHMRAVECQDDAEPGDQRCGNPDSTAGSARSPLLAAGREQSRDGCSEDHGNVDVDNQRCPCGGDGCWHLSLLSSLMKLTLPDAVLSSN